jgi:hypothetical protein
MLGRRDLASAIEYRRDIPQMYIIMYIMTTGQDTASVGAVRGGADLFTCQLRASQTSSCGDNPAADLPRTQKNGWSLSCAIAVEEVL